MTEMNESEAADRPSYIRLRRKTGAATSSFRFMHMKWVTVVSQQTQVDEEKNRANQSQSEPGEESPSVPQDEDGEEE